MLLEGTSCSKSSLSSIVTKGRKKMVNKKYQRSTNSLRIYEVLILRYSQFAYSLGLLVIRRGNLKVTLFLACLFFVASARAQITSGKILFERKTNLYKRFKNADWVTNWVKESDKTKVDEFEMF